MGELRQTSTENNDIWIDEIDDLCEPTRQPINVPRECCSRRFISLPGANCNFHCRKSLTCRSGVIRGHARTRKPGLKAAFASTPALWARIFLGHGPGKRVVTPLSRYAPRSVEQPSIDHDTTAASGSKNHSEYDVRVLCRTIGGFGQGEAVSIVGKSHRHPERRLQVMNERTSVEPRGIGILYEESEG
jgi:hypothetical protein